MLGLAVVGDDAEVIVVMIDQCWRHFAHHNWKQRHFCNKVENSDTFPTKVENGDTFPTKVERHFFQRCWKQFDNDSSCWSAIYLKAELLQLQGLDRVLHKMVIAYYIDGRPVLVEKTSEQRQRTTPGLSMTRFSSGTVTLCLWHIARVSDNTPPWFSLMYIGQTCWPGLRLDTSQMRSRRTLIFINCHN